MLIFAKGIANGFPLSGIASTNELMSRQKPGSMGGTYAGNAVACAAATAVIKAFKDEKVLDNVAKRSDQLVDFLKNLQKDPKLGHLIEDVRGRGLMIGVQFANTPTNAVRTTQQWQMEPRSQSNWHPRSSQSVSSAICSC